MDLDDDSLHSGSQVPKITVIQNISTLDLTLYNHSTEESKISEFPLSTGTNAKKIYETSEKLDNYKEKPLNLAENFSENLRSELNDKNMKLISVEIDFLKQSVSYLQSQIHNKSLEITTKDEKILKLEKVIEKQKRKLKDLKSRVKFQESKLIQMEDRLPKYHDLVEKFKFQENCKADLDEKYMRLESLVSRIDGKKTKITSSSPRPKNPASPYRLYSPRMKKTS